MKYPLPSIPAARRCPVWLCLAAVSGLPGCAAPLGGWSMSYEEAEHIAASRNADLVVYYRDHLDPECGVMADTLNDIRVRPFLNGKVKCTLITEYEPNRRFAAQYGVDGAPALIVIHRDQTYHALVGLQSADALASFLRAAQPPGQKAQLNPQLPREYAYQWEGIYDRAVEQARRQNRKLLIVYKWWLSGESTELLRRMSRPEVARHFGDMVHCLLDWDYVPNRRSVASYGVDKVPAIIIVHQDGTYHAHTGLCDIEEIVRFVVNARAPGQVPGGPTRTVVSGYSWTDDFDRAWAEARRRRQSLLVFYHSPFSDDSLRMEQLLSRTEVADLFSDMVHCKLDWGSRDNREVMTRYGVDRVPALLIVCPDGTYHVRIGAVGVADLVALVRASQPHGRTETRP